MLQRAERKHYEDVAVLLGSGLSLAQGLAAARALYGSGFPVRESLKALVFFEDGDLGELRPELRKQLEKAVLAVDAIPSLARIRDDLLISHAATARHWGGSRWHVQPSSRAMRGGRPEAAPIK